MGIWLLADEADAQGLRRPTTEGTEHHRGDSLLSVDVEKLGRKDFRIGKQPIYEPP